MNKTIEISETQAQALLILLNELIKEQHDLGNNDCNENDAFFKFSSLEQENAKETTDKMAWNFTAATYLQSVIKNKLEN